MVEIAKKPKTTPPTELRFEFGKNWRSFLTTLTDERIKQAEDSLLMYLGLKQFKGMSFLDIGSGSGLFSLAARRLGAKVHSFDYDPQSVACTASLKERYFKKDDGWQVEQGSALDEKYLKALGQFDIVYSWGVLHHTGSMWQALDLAAKRVKKGGYLFISIYNDQGWASECWKRIKKLYNRSGRLLRIVLTLLTLIRFWSRTFIKDLIKNKNPCYTWRKYHHERGMSAWHDIVDWVGGYPFEVAKPEEIFEFFKERDFELIRLKTCAGGVGCNEYVFKKK